VIPLPAIFAAPCPVPRTVLPDGCGEADIFALLLNEVTTTPPDDTAETEGEADPAPPEADEVAALALALAPILPNLDLLPEVEEGDEISGIAGMDTFPEISSPNVSDPNASASLLPVDTSENDPPVMRHPLISRPIHAAALPGTMPSETTVTEVKADPAETLVLLRAERIEPHGITAPPITNPSRRENPLSPLESPEAMVDDQVVPTVMESVGEQPIEGTGPARPAPARLPSLPAALQPLITRIAETLEPDDQGDGISLDLAADELGPLRLTIRSEGDRIEVHVMAESAGTLDLMRRHAEQLAQELRLAGYRQAEMSFGNRGHERRPPAGGGAPPPGDPAPLPPLAVHTTLSAAGRLDLRF
jgi:hypothetical protein